MSLNIDFSFNIKLTAHKCSCNDCKKPIKKGKKRFTIQAWGYRQSRTQFYHPPCFLRKIKKMMKVKKKDSWLQGINLGIQLMMES